MRKYGLPGEKYSAIKDASYIGIRDTFHYKTKDEYVPAQGWFGTRGGNHLRGAIIGHGVVNVPECLKIAKEAGYEGWLSVEFEGIEDCLMALKADIDNLRGMIAAL